MSTIATSPGINDLDIAPIGRLLCCGMFDHTVKLEAMLIKLTLDQGAESATN